MSMYEINVKDTKGNDVSLNQYQGKVLLVVNTATGCGFTPQYDGLEALYQTYQAEGLEILDFPCNQFLGQAPGTNEELADFCKINYDTTFQTFAKIDVNGPNQHPLYSYLKGAVPAEELDADLLAFQERIKKHNITWQGDDIRWNFTKFLIGRDGTVIERIAPTTLPKDIAMKIATELKK